MSFVSLDLPEVILTAQDKESHAQEAAARARKEEAKEQLITVRAQGRKLKRELDTVIETDPAGGPRNRGVRRRDCRV
jgi:hypothetical protein